MTSNGCAADPSPPAGAAELQPRRTRDGSYSLWSERFGEGFHSADGALREARHVFTAPAELQRFPPGRPLTVVEVAVGTGTNTAALIEAAAAAVLPLRWWGLELDPASLALALADDRFRAPWSDAVLERLVALTGSERLLWGDARLRLPELVAHLEGCCDLVLMDAFSPRRCPELWTLEFVGLLARLLAPQGRLLTYCAAAAVRVALERAGLKLASLAGPAGSGWSAGTVASPTELPPSTLWRPLSPMEREHMHSTAGEPYRDPGARGTAAEILAARARAQACSGAEPSSAWQRRWGMKRRRSGAQCRV